jgi:hypothetical protein
MEAWSASTAGRTVTWVPSVQGTPWLGETSSLGSPLREACANIDLPFVVGSVCALITRLSVIWSMVGFPNAEVGAVHPKAMPVILTREEELGTWMAAPWPEAARLRRPCRTARSGS